MSIVVLILGLVMGSFLGALSYRIPKEISISKGRSKCPTCGKQIAWYDNIPVLSYLLLQGKCRHCHKEISLRYPLIEIACGFIFVIFYLLQDQVSANLPWLPGNELVKLVILFLVAFVTLAIFVIDAEHQIIPDEFVYLMWAVVVGIMIFNGFTPIYNYLAAGFVAALFLLVIHLITLGRGMGMGDVKLAIAMGTILGPVQTVLWLFIGFIIGGIVGAFLLVLHKAKMKDKVAFGPFLIVSFLIVALYGHELANIFFPYLPL